MLLQRAIELTQEKFRIQERMDKNQVIYTKAKKEFMRKTKPRRAMIKIAKKEIEKLQIDIDRIIMKDFSRSKSFKVYEDKIK